MSNNAIIVQARMGSARLKGKSLMKVGTKLLIDHVLERALSVNGVDRVVLATTNSHEDDCLALHVSKSYPVEIFRGSEENVRSRFVHIGLEKKLDTIIRLTADDPFKDPQLIYSGLSLFNAGKFEYLNNFEIPNIPIGMDFEILLFEKLLEHSKKFLGKENDEHVTLSLRHSSEVYKMQVKVKEFRPKVRLTIDDLYDLQYCRKIADEISRIGYDLSWSTTQKAILNLEKGL